MEFLKRMTGRKWIGLIMVFAMCIYLTGGDSVVAKMDELPVRLKSFFILIEKILPFLGMVGAYFGFSIGQGNADAAKSQADAAVKIAEMSNK